MKAADSSDQKHNQKFTPVPIIYFKIFQTLHQINLTIRILNSLQDIIVREAYRDTGIITQ